MTKDEALKIGSLYTALGRGKIQMYQSLISEWKDILPQYMGDMDIARNPDLYRIAFELKADTKAREALDEARHDLIAYIETTFSMLEVASGEEGIDISIGPNGEPPYTAKSMIALVNTLYKASIGGQK